MFFNFTGAFPKCRRCRAEKGVSVRAGRFIMAGDQPIPVCGDCANAAFRAHETLLAAEAGSAIIQTIRNERAQAAPLPEYVPVMPMARAFFTVGIKDGADFEKMSA